MSSDKCVITVLGVISALYSDDNSLWEQLEEGVDLIPGKLKMRLLTEKDRETYASKNPHNEMDAYSEKTPIIELRDTSVDEVTGDPFNLIDLTILALKLLKPGNPYIDGKYTIPSDEAVPYRDWSPIGKIYAQQDPWTMGCDLSSKDVDELRDLVNRLAGVNFNEKQWYAIACERFNKSFHTTLLPDKLIDYCIAFEALFMRGDYPKDGLSMGHTIGLGCSMLLGGDNSEREEIAESIQEVFKLRNDVVHGRVFKYERFHFEKMEAIEDCLRKSIVKLLPS